MARTPLLRRDWANYWNELPAGRILHQAESREFVRRLLEEVNVTSTDVVFDFGCGQGLAAELLAPLAGRIDCWDTAPAMRTAAAARLAAFPNSYVFEEDPFEREFIDRTYDYVLVNSVAQYMSRSEFEGWLPRWRFLLKPGGYLVLSDLIPPDRSLLGEALDLSRFARQKGIWRQSVVGAALEIGRRRLGRLPRLTHLAPAVLSGLAEKNDMDCRLIERGITHFPARYAAVLTRRG